MDTRKFDAFSKSIATGASRRSVIGGLFGGALAMAGLSRAAGAPADKVDICHYDEETGSFHIINVSGNARDAHLAHGDHLASAVTCGDDQHLADDGCSCVCTNPEMCWDGIQHLPEDGCSCVCNVYETEEPQCYWMEDFTGDFCWTPAYGMSQADCTAANSGCAFGGACYGWGTTTEGLSS